MQSLEVCLFMDFCNKLLQYLIYRIFLLGNKAPNGFWSSLLQRPSEKDSKKIYFDFLSFILFSTNFRTLKEFLEVILKNRKSESGKSRNSTGTVFGPRPHGSAGLAATRPTTPVPGSGRGHHVARCDRTSSEMRGLSSKIISGDSRRSENAQTHTHKHTV
jgi:hypothetical protein